MLVRSKLTESISQVDTDIEGQIWFTLSCWLNLKLGGVYIPPEDSPYYHNVHYDTLARHTADPGKVIVLSDFNARVGTPLITDNRGNRFIYRDVKDEGVNAHGRTLLNLCNNNALVMANHIYHNGILLGGDLSFRRRQT